MNTDDQRRVRKLHLRAADEQLIRRGAILVEDALHCASLPSSGPGLLCVRRLSLGRFRSNQSSMNLAAVIEQQLKQYAISAETPDLADTPDRAEPDEAAAVRFRDPTEPYLLLLERLIMGRRVDAWYWSSAVRCWDPRGSQSVALRKITLGVQQLESGPVALAHWLRRQAGVCRLHAVLNALQPTDGSAMLLQIGLASPARAPRTIQATTAPPPVWIDYVWPWVARWNRRDPRSFWLTAMFMIADNPARLCSPAWPENVGAMVEVVAQGATLESSAEIGVDTSVEIPELGLRRPGRRQEARPPVARPAPLHAESTQENVPTGMLDDRVFQRRLRQSEAADETPIHAIGKSAVSHDPQAADSNSRQTADGGRATVSNIASRRAGLLLLVRVLECLGIESWLESQPEWIELGAPLWILHDIAARMGTEPMDPVMRALHVDEAAPESDRTVDFVVPQSWHRGISIPGRCSLHQIDSGFLMLDASDRLPLAFWSELDDCGMVPDRIRLALGEGDWQIAAASQPPRTISPMTTPWELALRSWRCAIRRWCRRILRIGLHDVVSRLGHVAATETHIDVFFPNRQVDSRIRKAGLDIDPGWTPWLGKIITFHYVDELE